MVGEFVLKVEPEEKIVFESASLGKESVAVTLKISNPTKDKIACKVKCTSNDLFRIRPPVFFVEPEKDKTVSLTFAAGAEVPENGLHHFTIYHIKGTGAVPRDAWKGHKGDPDGSKRLTVDFKKEGGGKEEEKKEGAEKKEDKKDEEKKEEKKEDEKKEEKKEEEKKEDEKKDEKKDEKEEKKEDEKKEEGKEEEKKEGDDKKEEGEEKKEEGEDKKEDEGE